MSKCNTEATKQIRYTVIHWQWTYANYMFRQKCPLIGMTILFGICLPSNNQCFLFCGQANVTWTLCLVVSVILSSFAANINIHVRRSYDAAAGHSQLRMMFGKDDLAIFNRTKRSKMRYRRYESDTLSTNLSDKLDEKRRFRCWKKLTFSIHLPGMSVIVYDFHENSLFDISSSIFTPGQMARHKHYAMLMSKKLLRE